MFGSEILDVAVGVIFVFLLVSLIASAVREGLEGFLKTRASHLEMGIRELLHDREAKGLAFHFFQHPLIAGLYSGTYTPRKLTSAWATPGRNLPAYIPSRNFALALMDMVARGPQIQAETSSAEADPITIASLRANIALIENPPVQRILLTAIDNARGDLATVRTNIERWFDSGMDRVSGWYKRSTQWILLAIGIGVAIIMNVNAMNVAEQLYRNQAARQALVKSAQSAVADSGYVNHSYVQVKHELEKMPLPLGGSQKKDVMEHPVETLGGWLLTGIAASLGAPFWFDLLNKIMVVRSTVKPHEKSGEEGSEDRPEEKTVTVKPPAAEAPAA